jgi:transposase
VAERVQVGELGEGEGMRLLRILRRGTGSVVTWRRAQMLLLSAQGMPVPRIAEVTFTSPDRVRDVLHNFNTDGFDSIYPRYRGGRPPTFTLPQRQRIKRLALSRPHDHDLPFSTWSLAKRADFLVAEGVVDDISHEGLRVLLGEEGVSFQRLKTWKTSRDPDYEAKTNRVLHLYGLMDGTADAADGDPDVVICLDEFGPLNLQPHPGRHWALGTAGRWRYHPKAPPGAGGGQPTNVPTACGTCWRPMTATATASTATSSPANAVVSSSPHLPAVCTQSVSAVDQGRARAGQRLGAPFHPEGCAGWAVGGGEQRRVGLHPDQCQLPQPDRAAVHRVAVLRAGRHRPRLPRRAGVDDPPLHCLAKPERQRQSAPNHNQQGKGCLKRY